MGNTTRADYELNVKLHGKMFNFTHHIGYSGWWQQRPAALARELVKMHSMNNANGFLADCLIRSHVHYYNMVEFPKTKAFTTPAWKFPDGFMYRHGIPELPTVGFIEVIVETNGKILVEPHLMQMKFPKPIVDMDKLS